MRLDNLFLQAQSPMYTHVRTVCTYSYGTVQMQHYTHA